MQSECQPSEVRTADDTARRPRHFGARIAVALSLVLLAGVAAGATYAYIVATSDSVVNTFTYGNIEIELTETDTALDDDNDAKTNLYKMVPGREIAKDPTITVKKDSEPCYLFVKLEESTDPDFSAYLTYAVDSTWIQLKDSSNNDVPGVYYQTIGSIVAGQAIVPIAADQRVSVLKNDKVTVKTTVTKAQIDALAPGGALPTLKVTAYAVQREGIGDAYAAWQQVEGAAPTPTP